MDEAKKDNPERKEEMRRQILALLTQAQHLMYSAAHSITALKLTEAVEYIKASAALIETFKKNLE